MDIDEVRQIQKNRETDSVYVTFQERSGALEVLPTIVSDEYLMGLLERSASYQKKIAFEADENKKISKIYLAEEDEISQIEENETGYCITHKGSEGLFQLSNTNSQQQVFLSKLQQAQAQGKSFAYVTDAFLEYLAVKVIEKE